MDKRIIKLEYAIKIRKLTSNRKLSKIREKEIAREIQLGNYVGGPTKEANYISRFYMRHILLSYGFMMGKAYHSIERKCSIKPSVFAISNITGAEQSIIADWLDRKDLSI